MKKCERTAGSAEILFQSLSSRLPYFRFEMGDVYLFHKRNPHCPAESSLWGQFDRREGTFVYLESSTTDHLHFRMWHRLPDGYCYCRRSTRSEFRDYVVNQMVRETCVVQDGEREMQVRKRPGSVRI